MLVLNKKLFLIVVAGGLLTSIVAHAEEDLFSLSLEELLTITVSSTSFFEQSSIQSTGSSWVFTQREMKNSPIIFLKDIFEFYAPSTNASYSSFTGSAIGVRGITVSDNDKTLYMVDGQNMNQISLYGYQAGMQSTLLGDIDRVEVVNGPGAILHGSGAINNIINVIPKTGENYQGLNSSLEYGHTDKLTKLEMGYGKDLGQGKNYYIYGGMAQADGFLPDTYLEQGEQPSPSTDINRKVYKISSNYRFSGYATVGDFELQSQLQRVHRSFNKSSSVTDAAINRGHWQTYWSSRVKYNWQLDEDSRVEFSVPLAFYDHGVHLSLRDGEKGGRESHAGFKGVFFQTTNEHKLAIGTSVSHRSFDAQKQYFESNKFLLEESLTGDLRQVELFAEDTWQLNTDWSVSVGLRYDHVNYGAFYEPESQVSIYPNDLSALTKRLASSYQISPQQTLKAVYQEGFRYPDVSYYLYFGIENNALVNADLEPFADLREESVKSIEISYLQSLLDYSASWELNLYYNIHKNTLSWVSYTQEMLGVERYNVARNAIGFGPGAYANADGKFNAYGAEIAANWQPYGDLMIRGSYDFSRPSGVPDNINATMNLVNQSGKWANYPEHLFKLALNWQASDKLHLNLTTYYSPDVNICTSDCSQPPSLSERFHQQNRFRLNGLLKYQINQTADISFIVQNAFENEGPPVGYDTRDGTAKEGGLGDDSRRMYIRVTQSL